MTMRIFHEGVVEDIHDPLQAGRVRVRVFGIDSSSKNEIPTEKLPWATVNGSTTSANTSGIGMTPHGLVEGSWVYVVFLDAPNNQMPMVLGSISGIPSEKIDKSKGFSDPTGVYPKYLNEPDVNRAARGIKTTSHTNQDANTVKNVIMPDGTTWSEPTETFKAAYPNNKVIETESGHMIELDDTKDNERLRICGKNGSLHEFNNVSTIDHTVNDRYTVTTLNHYEKQKNHFEVVDQRKVMKIGNQFLIVVENGGLQVVVLQGGLAVSVHGDANINVTGSSTINMTGNITLNVVGNITEKIQGNRAIECTGNLKLTGATVDIVGSKVSIN